jgi:hypothetical protein
VVVALFIVEQKVFHLLPLSDEVREFFEAWLGFGVV